MTRRNVGMAALLAVAAAAVGATSLLGARAGFGLDPARLLTSASLAAAGLLSCYLCLLALLVCLTGLPGQVSHRAHHLGLRVAPRLFPRLLATVLLTGGVLGTSPAYAATQPCAVVADSGTSRQVQGGLQLPTPSWGADRVPLPRWDGAAAYVAPPAPLLPDSDISLVSPAGREPRPAHQVVRRGDTLWSLAARSLPAGTSGTRIAAEVQRWYAANRSVIGDDPDLILPGQVLQAPVAGGQR